MAEAPDDIADTGASAVAPATEEEKEASAVDMAGCVNAVTGGSWWGGLLEAAKTKSVSAIDFVKKDIAEFTTTMQTESGSLASNVRGKLNHETAVAATQRVKHGMSFLIDGIKTALIIPPEDMDEDEAEPLTVSGGQFFDRAKARLHAVQIDPGTYCNEPSGSAADFEAWRAKFELESMKGDISELLVSNVQVRALYTQMVPASVSHADFWQRYFYKLYQLEQEEQRRDDLKKRADVAKEEDDLAWDDEDDWDNMEAPPPASQDPAPRKVAEGSPCITTPPSQTPGADTTTTSDTAPHSADLLGNTTDNAQTNDSSTNDHKTPAPGPMDTDRISEATTTKTTAPTTAKESVDVVTSPTDTVDSLSSMVTDPRFSSADTLTVVTAEESASDIPDHEVAPSVLPASEAKQSPNITDELKTKEKGDIVVVVGDNNGSDSLSPPTSDSNSHNKETDDDWEKDFDIEVTEEELTQFKETSEKDLVDEIKDEDDDWESWE